VIEDEKGTRLLLGAPIPRTEGRKRRDELTNEIVLLEENGTDRLVVGDAIQPQILGSVGKRSGTEHSSGFWSNDSNRNERGRYITTGDDALLTLDYAASDAFHLSAGIDSCSLMLRAPGGRPRAMGVTEGDRRAKLLCSFSLLKATRTCSAWTCRPQSVCLPPQRQRILRRHMEHESVRLKGAEV
jgi:hypothetical protein